MMNLPDQLLNIDDHDLFDTPRLIESWTEYFLYDETQDKSICTICDKKLSGRFKGNQKTHLMTHHPQEAAAMNCTIKRKSTASFEVPLSDPKKSRLSNGRLGYNETSDEDSDLELVEEVKDIPDDWERFFVYNQETDKTKCNLCKVGKPLNGNSKDKKQRHLMMYHPKILSDGDMSALPLHINGFDDRDEITNGAEPQASSRPEQHDSDSESSKRRSMKKAEEWEKYFIYDAVTNTTRCTLCSADKNPKKGNYRGNNKKHLMVIHRDVAIALNLMPEVVPMNGNDSMNHPMVPFEQEMVCFDGDNAGHPNQIGQIGSQKAMLEFQVGKILADPEFFWRIIGRKIGEIPESLKNALNAIDYNTFMVWKGFNLRSLDVAAIVPLFKTCDATLFAELSNSLGSKLNILYAIAGEVKAIDTDKEIHAEMGGSL